MRSAFGQGGGEGGLNASPGLLHLFTATTVILQIFSNWSQSARLSAGGGGNCYLGNAQMQSIWTIMGLPLIASYTLADRKLVMVPLDGVFLFF